MHLMGRRKERKDTPCKETDFKLWPLGGGFHHAPECLSVDLGLILRQRGKGEG